MKRVTSILLMLLLCFTAYSQDESLTDSQTERKSKKIEIYFDRSSYAINPEYHTNKKSLTDLTDLITLLKCDSLFTISGIEINSYTSPDGDVLSNNRLSQRRSESILQYLKTQFTLDSSLISVKSSGIAWDMLRELVMQSETPYKEEVLHIIDNTTIETWLRINPKDRWQTLVDSRNKHLMDLRLGVPYRYMKKNIFPSLRRSSILTIYYQRVAEPAIVKKEVIIEQEQKTDLDIQLNIADNQELNELKEDLNITETKNPLFAIKTNLLYSLALIPSLEIEVPIGERWSIATEAIFPWWVTKDNANALQMLSGQVEGRYWFGNRTEVPQLTGWFAGFYAGGGLYDLQWKGNGYQGEFFIASGLSGGYSHTINKSGSLRLEYSLGFGYLKTNYRYYEGMQNNEYLVWQRDGNYTWIGPTKAKVSLVWMLNKRGGKR